MRRQKEEDAPPIIAVRAYCAWEKVVIEAAASPWKSEPERLSETMTVLMWNRCWASRARDGAVGEGKGASCGGTDQIWCSRMWCTEGAEKGTGLVFTLPPDAPVRTDSSWRKVAKTNKGTVSLNDLIIVCILFSFSKNNTKCRIKCSATRTGSTCPGMVSRSLWISTGGMNTIISKDILSLGVLMMVVRSVFEPVCRISPVDVQLVWTPHTVKAVASPVLCMGVAASMFLQSFRILN